MGKYAMHFILAIVIVSVLVLAKEGAELSRAMMALAVMIATVLVNKR